MGNRKRGRKGHGFQAQQRPPGSRTTDVDNEHGCRSSSRSSRGRLSLSWQNLRTPSTMLKTRFKTTKVSRLTSSALSSHADLRQDPHGEDYRLRKRNLRTPSTMLKQDAGQRKVSGLTSSALSSQESTPQLSRIDDVDDDDHRCRPPSRLSPGRTPRPSRGRLTHSRWCLRTPSTMLEQDSEQRRVSRLTSSASSSRESTLHLS